MVTGVEDMATGAEDSGGPAFATGRKLLIACPMYGLEISDGVRSFSACREMFASPKTAGVENFVFAPFRP